MKKLLVILLLLFPLHGAWAEDRYNCVDNKGFHQVYVIDFKKKTVLHKYFHNTITDQVYARNKYRDVISFKNNVIIWHVLKEPVEKFYVAVHVFDINQKILTVSTLYNDHYPFTSAGRFHNNVYRCFKL